MHCNKSNYLRSTQIVTTVLITIYFTSLYSLYNYTILQVHVIFSNKYIKLIFQYTRLGISHKSSLNNPSHNFFKKKTASKFKY